MPFHPSKGFSILEILIALFLVSVSVASVFSMQTVGIKALNASRIDTHADWLARDLLERIRANPLGDYQLSGEGPAGACDMCATPDELAQRDLYEWWTHVRQSPLSNPNAVVLVRTDATIPASFYSVVLQWDSTFAQVNRSALCQDEGEHRACYVVEARL